MEHVDEVAVLNTMWMNQDPMQYSYTPIPYQTPQAAFLNSSHFLVHPTEAYLQELLMMHEADLGQQQLTTNNTGGSGLSKERVSKHLHVYTAQGEETDTCCICLCEFEKNEKMGTLECGHKFHADCIKRWLLSKNVCPMCRSTAITA